MNYLRRHLSYANIVATFALVFAMSGTAIAAHHYLINSTKQINPSVLKALKGNAGKAGAPGAPGSAGLTGAKGDAGPKGEGGPSGISGYQVVEGNVAEGTKSGFNLSTSVAECPSGKKLLGGGFRTLTGANTTIFVADDGPSETHANTWEVLLTNSTVSAYSQRAFAICATVTS
jgi:hypothetical protein